MSEPIGQKLRRLRQETGLNQAQFGELVNLSQAGVSKIENGSRMPSRQAIEAWLAACGKTMEIAGIPDLSEGERELLSAAAEVEPDDLYLLSEALRGLATVRGADRDMARKLLEWLAGRAPRLLDEEADDEASAPPIPAQPATRVRK